MGILHDVGDERMVPHVKPAHPALSRVLLIMAWIGLGIALAYLLLEYLGRGQSLFG